jgi:hypothetical protein
MFKMESLQVQAKMPQLKYGTSKEKKLGRFRENTKTQ